MRRSLRQFFQKQVQSDSKLSQKKKLLFSTAFFSFFLLLVGVSFLQEYSTDPNASLVGISSELNIADSSPLGDAFGLVVPASCPSDLHDEPNYNTICNSAANSCGVTNSGTIQCGGTCSATTPANCSGWISASPNPCTIASGASLCSSTISWGTSNTPSATVTIDGNLFANASSGSSVAPWISVGNATFILRGATNTYLSQVTVNGVCVSGTSWDGGKCAPPVPVPAAPASISGSCPSPGTTSTISWSAVSGATSYALRADNTTANGWSNSCTSPNAGDFCSDVTGTSRSQASSAGANYNVWVHACNSSGCSVATGGSFTCTAPATTINGVCSSTAETCSSGTYSNSPADTSTNYQWTCLGSGSPAGTNSGTCTAPIPSSPTPVTTFTGSYSTQTNQTTLDLPSGGGTVNLNWSVTNAVGGSCTGYSTTGVTGWSTTGTGGKSVTGTNVPVTVSNSTRFDLDCWNSSGTAAVRRSVQVNVAPLAATPTFTICPAAGRTLYEGATSSLSAWYDATGVATTCGSFPTNVTSSATWSSNNTSVVTVSGGTITGVNAGSTTVRATYSGLSDTAPVNVIPLCVTGCTNARAITVCRGDTYDAVDSCGVPEICNGSRLCDYNWKEVAP